MKTNSKHRGNFKHCGVKDKIPRRGCPPKYEIKQPFESATLPALEARLAEIDSRREK
jgi:hypothetical protein